MRVIADTHSFLWFIAGDARLSARARDVLSEPRNDVAVSIASLWEIAIKVRVGKLRLERPFGELVPQQLARNAIRVLPIEIEHLVRISTLPMHHRDPFDRVVVAQSLEEHLPLVSTDDALDAYGIQRIW